MTAPIRGEMLELVHDVYHNYMNLDMDDTQVLELYHKFTPELQCKIAETINTTSRFEIMDDLAETICGSKYPNFKASLKERQDFEILLAKNCEDFGYKYIIE